MATIDPLSVARDLALELRKLGIDVQDLGKALLPDGSPSTRNRTGRRLLDGSHDPQLSRLKTVVDTLGLRLVIDPRGVRVERV
jgi:DNA-binding phage protein